LSRPLILPVRRVLTSALGQSAVTSSGKLIITVRTSDTIFVVSGL